MKIGFRLSLLAIAFLLVPGCTKSCAKDKPADDVGVFFESPKDGDHVKSPFEVKFGVKGKTIKPAMEDLKDKNSGHHHLLIDDAKVYVDEGQVVLTDENHIHYGKGETSAILNLPPGKHTLSLQFADGAHISYGKGMATTITVIVDEEEKAPEAGAGAEGEDAAQAKAEGAAQ